MRASPNKDGLKYGVVCDFLNGSQIKYQLRSDPCLTLNFTRGTATNITGGNISWRPNAPKNGDFHALHDSGMALVERLEYPFAPKKKIRIPGCTCLINARRQYPSSDPDQNGDHVWIATEALRLVSVEMSWTRLPRVTHLKIFETIMKHLPPS
jgi:hypothetical protein